MKESENQLRMIDMIPALTWCCRPDGTTEFLNQRWLDYTGLSLEEALGWGWKALIHPEDFEKLMDTWLGLLASGEPGEEEARIRRFDGEYRWFLFRAVPVRDLPERASERKQSRGGSSSGRPLHGGGSSCSSPMTPFEWPHSPSTSTACE